MKKMINKVRRAIGMGLTSLVGIMPAVGMDRVDESIELDPELNIHFQIINVGKDKERKKIPAIDDLVVQEDYVPMQENNYNMLMANDGKQAKKKAESEIEMASEKERIREDSKQTCQKYNRNLGTIILTKNKKEKDNEGIRLSGIGSGIILTQDGFILTDYHVIDEGGDVNVLSFYEGKNGLEERVDKAKVVAHSKKRDLALCKGSGNYDINVPRIADDIKQGERIIALYQEFRNSDKENGNGKRKATFEEGIKNNPFEGLVFSATVEEDGIKLQVKPKKDVHNVYCFGYGGNQSAYLAKNLSVSPVYEKVKVTGLDHALEYLVPVAIKGAGGNSGGPIFNRKGDLTGLISAASCDSNRGYMIAPETIRDFLKQYYNHGKTNKGKKK